MCPRSLHFIKFLHREHIHAQLGPLYWQCSVCVCFFFSLKPHFVFSSTSYFYIVSTEAELPLPARPLPSLAAVHECLGLQTSCRTLRLGMFERCPRPPSRAVQSTNGLQLEVKCVQTPQCEHVSMCRAFLVHVHAHSRHTYSFGCLINRNEMQL